jgi:poly(hydroxyalkanoate) granule-associated protein
MTAKKKKTVTRKAGTSRRPPRAARSAARAKTTRRRATAPRTSRARTPRAKGRLERDVGAFAEKLGIDTREAARMLREWNRRFERELHRASRQIDSGVAEVQKVVRKEQRALGRMVEDAVQRALASLNIPTRQEVQALTRKVHQLSRKVDRFGR